jgi:hypothetical protein
VRLTRAGWYSYDILDNLGRRSARRIIPELQGLDPGDVVPMSPDGKQGMRAHSMDAPRSMVWGTQGETTWAWHLDADSDGSTRLITRVRSRYRWWLPPSIAFSALLEFGYIWMMRKMLLNMPDRADAVRRSQRQLRRNAERPERGPEAGPRPVAGREEADEIVSRDRQGR